MSDVKVWKEDDPGQPSFPSNFDVKKKAALQVTDIVTNRNKYYAIELHTTGKKFRVYTHYGRTDDLETNPEAGVRESRYFDYLEDAEDCYQKIYAQKTSARKGYKEMSLASSKIGSKKTYGQSTGTIDEKTLQKLAQKDPTIVKSVVTISKEIQDIVSYLYSEATKALVTTVNATITANGIETPLGVLTIGQIEKGQAVLDTIGKALQKKKSSDLISLSGEFYTVIPHRFGRSREAAQQAVIDSATKYNEKQDTLQLMRDMLSVNGKGNVLANPEIQKKYDALNCKIETVDSDTFNKMKKFVQKSSDGARVRNIWAISRAQEVAAFANNIGNQQLLFHGSAARNWVGILSRGLLMPKTVVSLGVTRTDAGWLGNGIYFGDVATTSLAYAQSGKRGTSFLSLVNVALGKMKEYKRITYGLSKPPDGFDSCHGNPRGDSEFDDDEFVIYDTKQQKLQYLVEVEGY